MRTCASVAALVCLAAGVSAAADNQLSPQEKSAGWILLFDGKTFDHWVDPTKQSPPGDSFAIEDGCLAAQPRPKIMEDLFSTTTYRDFELEFDWKISPAGNSGVKYRIQDHQFLLAGRTGKFEDIANASMRDRRKDRPARGQDYVIGFEYQIVDNSSNPDATRGGALHQAGALYDAFAPSRDATRPVGEFNHSRLVVKGNHVEHWMNGVKVVDASLDDPQVASAAAKRWGMDTPIYDLLAKHPRVDCPISLQNHNDHAWFKNIKIRVLE